MKSSEKTIYDHTEAAAPPSLLVQYTKFLLNGGLLGLLAWAVQLLAFQVFGSGSALIYSAASAVTCLLLAMINYQMQRRFIFSADGAIYRFIAVQFAMMLLVSGLAPICRAILTLVWSEAIGDGGGFALASVLAATPSFLLSRNFVFPHRSKPVVTS